MTDCYTTISIRNNPSQKVHCTSVFKSCCGSVNLMNLTDKNKKKGISSLWLRTKIRPCACTVQHYWWIWCTTLIFKLLFHFLLLFLAPCFFSFFCQPPSSAPSLSCSLICMCIVHLQSGVWDGCLECLCCILLLIHFPLKHFLFPSQIYSLTCTHKLLLTHKIWSKKRLYTHTHTHPTDLSHLFKLPTHPSMNVLVCRFMFVCIGAFIIVESMRYFLSLLCCALYLFIQLSSDTVWLIALTVFQVSI